MAENEDIDIDNPDDAVNEETDDNNDITEFELGTANIPGIKRELKRLYALHPELIIDYKETLKNRIPLSVVQPSMSNSDPLHTTYPFVTLFEKTKIIGLRANQLSQGARPFIVVPKEVTDVRDIARLEFQQKRLPYMIKRPLPDGTFEIWRLVDLMIL
jgi:DNA-directed RNA polymerase I, II, and III subunit RPABC2